MQYPWSTSGFLDPPSLGMTLQLVGDCGWVARLVCRAFADASRIVTESSIDSVERLALVRIVNKWREPSNLCNFAARAGHLDLLQWAARCYGYPWDYQTCCYAASGGHLEVLQWARLNEVP